MENPPLPMLVEHIFRHRYGDLISGLCRVLGPGRLDLVEDVVQEAMVRALVRWPVGGVPEQPDAWVFRVAKNLAVDALRRGRVARDVEEALSRWADESVLDAPAADDASAGGISDDTLRMMFTCSHPAVPVETRVPLVLKTVGGFGVSEIAGALLTKEGTIAQRLTRAKARLQREQVGFEVPPDSELTDRLENVLEVLYLMFNEGYRAYRGKDLVRQDILEEAVRLTALLLDHPATARPEVHALLAIMLFLGSRLPARVDPEGELLTLAEQDRALWDRAWIQCGFGHFQSSIRGDRITTYHVEASIAATHAGARDYASTDWTVILREYDRLLGMTDTPVVRLNRAVALAKVSGPQAGIDALRQVQDAHSMSGYFLLPATLAHLHWTLSDHAAAERSLRAALAMSCSEPEERLLQRRLAACQAREAAPPW